MKKNLCAFFLVFLLFSVQCVPVFASAENLSASSDSSSEDGGWPTFDAIGDFFKGLFIPRANYFQNKTTELNDKVNAKMGGLSQLFNIIQNLFNSLNDSGSTSFSMSIPKGHFFSGSPALNANLFSSSGIPTILNMVKGILNSFVCVFTAITAYHKLRKLFEASGG